MCAPRTHENSFSSLVGLFTFCVSAHLVFSQSFFRSFSIRCIAWYNFIRKWMHTTYIHKNKNGNAAKVTNYSRKRTERKLVQNFLARSVHIVVCNLFGPEKIISQRSHFTLATIMRIRICILQMLINFEFKPHKLGGARRNIHDVFPPRIATTQNKREQI